MTGAGSVIVWWSTFLFLLKTNGYSFYVVLLEAVESIEWAEMSPPILHMYFMAGRHNLSRPAQHSECKKSQSYEYFMAQNCFKLPTHDVTQSKFQWSEAMCLYLVPQLFQKVQQWDGGRQHESLHGTVFSQWCSEFQDRFPCLICSPASYFMEQSLRSDDDHSTVHWAQGWN